MPVADAAACRPTVELTTADRPRTVSHSRPQAWAHLRNMPTPTASIPRAAAWMAGWLTLMVVIAVAGREATRELSVFQVMLLRSVLGLGMLWPHHCRWRGGW